MLNAVLDSTVLISAFLAQGGVSNELLRHAREGAFVLCLSAEILDGVIASVTTTLMTRRSLLLTGSVPLATSLLIFPLSPALSVIPMTI
jgi:predicted nucleic acid-binding protein